MPTLEERVKTLEREVTDLKGRVDVNDGETQNMSELIKVEHRLTNSRIDRLGRDVSESGALLLS